MIALLNLKRSCKVNSISSITTSNDNRFFLSADSGSRGSTINIWNNNTDNADVQDLFPARTFDNVHGGFGTASAEFTNDGKYLITLGNGTTFLLFTEDHQSICVWDLSSQSDLPQTTVELVGALKQTKLYLNPYDQTEFLTIGPKGVYFYCASADFKSIVRHQPLVTNKDFKIFPSDYVTACFQPNGTIIVGNEAGELVYFKSATLDDLFKPLKRGEKSTVKYLKIENNPITCLMVYQDVMVVGTQAGAIKFFDFDGILLYGYSGIKSGISCMQANISAGYIFDDSALPALLISTFDSTIYSLTRSSISPLTPLPVKKIIKEPSDSKSQLDEDISLRSGLPLLQILATGLPPKITALDVSPSKDDSVFIISTKDGYLQLWDYQTKKLLQSRHFTTRNAMTKSKHGFLKYEDLNRPINTITFSPCMNYLGVGFNDGALVFLTPTLGDTNANFELSQSPIDTITFSNTGEYCAVTDLHFTITLFQNLKDWKVIFRSRPHFMDIKATLFHQNSVIFVSRDRHLTTVDLSSLVMTTRRIESVDRPTAAIVVTENNDEMVLCFNSGLKAKLYSSSQVCRRTSRGPPRSVQKAIAIGKDYVAFGSENHAGIARLELDGNCLRYGSVVAHGVDVKEIKFKGDFLLTLGSDNTINIWKIDFGFLEAQVCRYASDKVFLEMLETDNSIPQGKVFKTFEDYFYLLQLE